MLEILEPARRGGDHPTPGSVWSALVASVEAEGVTVTIDAFDPARRFGPCSYLAAATPVRGQSCVVVFDAETRPWVVGFRGANVASGGGGGAPSGPAGGVLSGTYPNPGFAVDMATQAELDAHLNDTVDAHDASAISYAGTTGIVATNVEAAIDEVVAEAVMDGDVAGGVLAGTYPNPSFAVDMATQAELDALSGTIAGLRDVKDSVRVATTPANTYIQSGGAVTQIDGLVVDGETLDVGDRVLIKDCGTAGTETPTFVNTSVASSAASVSNLDIAIPAGTQGGDTMYIVASKNSIAANWVAPGGWTQMATQDNSLAGHETAVFRKVAAGVPGSPSTGADAPGSLVNVSVTSLTFPMHIVMGVWRGSAGTSITPGVAAQDSGSITSHPIDASALVPTSNALALYIYTSSSPAYTMTPPTGFAEVYDAIVAGPAIEIAWKVVPAGSLGTITGTSSTNTRGVVFAVATHATPSTVLGPANGIYEVTSTAGGNLAVQRAADADASADVTAGMFVYSVEGSQDETGWILTTDDPIVLNTTNLVFESFESAQAVTAGSALLKTGNVLDVLVDDSTIEVDTVADRLRVKAAGIAMSHLSSALQVLLGSNVHAYHNTTQSIANSSIVPLTFNSELFDNGGLHSTVTNPGRLTAATAGIYQVSLNVNFATNATGDRSVWIRKNGTISAGNSGKSVSEAGIGTALACSALLTLAAGDYVDAAARQNSGGALNIEGGAGNCDFSMVRVG